MAENDITTLLNAALEYAENGIRVFPLVPKDKKPLTKNGVKDATTNEETIRRWWNMWPEANIGIAVGGSFVGIDIDYKDGCRPDFLVGLPPTVVCKTPTGGHHAYFKTPEEGIKNGLKLETGATVRATGYYFVAPPSVHPNGGTYRWSKSGSLGIGEAAELPQWIIEKGREAEVKKESFKLPEEIPHGEQHLTLFQYGCSLRATGSTESQILAAFVVHNERLEKPAPLKNLEELAADICKRYEQGKKYYSQKEEEKSNDEEIQKIIDECRGLPLTGKGCIGQKEIQTIAKHILDIRFKMHVDEQATILYNIKDIEKKELLVCHNEELLLRRLSQNITELLGKVPSVEVTNKFFAAWKLSTEPLTKQPEPFIWSEQDAWTFKKLDFTPMEGTYPAWEEFLDRCSSPEDFMAFIWSIFEPRSISRQYLYLCDPHGQGGKTTIINTLGEIFGNAYTAINNTFVSGSAARWLLGNLYGKRLVGWPDVKNTKFCMSEILRNITSGDDVAVEFKGKPPFATRMYLKLIMASNHEPTITSGGADLSRLIRIDLKENKSSKNDPAWREKIKSELPHFLWACRKEYEKKCPNHGNIVLGHKTMELIEHSAEGLEVKFDDIIERRIEFGDNYKATVSEWVKLCKEERLTDHDVGNFKDYLSRVCPSFHTKRPKVGGKKITTYYGIKINELRGQVVAEYKF